MRPSRCWRWPSASLHAATWVRRRACSSSWWSETQAISRHASPLPRCIASAATSTAHCKHAREVLVRNPSETRALVEVGRVYRAQKELDVAELVLEKARIIDDKNAAIYNELGLLALDRGDTQLAFTQFAQRPVCAMHASRPPT